MKNPFLHQEPFFIVFVIKGYLVLSYPNQLFMRIFLTLSLLLISVFMFSQEGTLQLSGYVEKGREPLSNVKVTLYQNSNETGSEYTDNRGAFSLDMDINKQYTIHFSKEGFVRKKLFVNASVPGEKGGTWTVEFSIGLFRMYPGLDVSALEDPVTKIVYQEEERSFGYDYLYTEKMMAKIDKILAQLEKLKEEAYREIIRTGDRHFDQAAYAEAITWYEKALDQRPGDRYPKKRIREAEKLLEEKRENQSLYEQAIARADQLFQQEKYREARNVYGEAIGYDGSKDYPRDRIREIDEILQQLRAEKQQQEENQRKYNAFIKTADQAFNAENFSSAKAHYNKALEIFSDKPYPRQQITKIDQLLAQKAKQQKADEAYTKMIEEADQLFKLKEYIRAKSKYREAQSIKPQEIYPVNQVKRIDQLLADQKAKEQRYGQLIQSADQAFQNESYSRSKSDYLSALEIRSDASYPRQQIDKINDILQKQQAKQASYKQNIQKADVAFQNKEYDRAKSLYSEAFFIMPEKQYPKDQIDEIDRILAGQRAANQRYKAAIGKADRTFQAGKYDVSRNAYVEASAIKPGEAYPREQIQKIDNLLASQARKEEQYKALIKQADQEFEQKDYTAAKKKYQESLQVKPGESYPSQQIQKIDELLANLQARRQKEAKYENMLAKADQAFEEENYSEAKQSYSEVLFIKPDEQYPKDQISRIDEILAQRARADAERKQAEKAYNEAIEKGDAMFSMEEYRQAKQSYKQALSVKPGEGYPRSQVEKIEQILAKRKNLAQQYTSLIAEADQSFDRKYYIQAKSAYQQALDLKPGESYPQQRIDEISQLLKDLAAKKRNDQQYKEAIKEADAAFDRQEYTLAKSMYSEALFVKPTETYPKEQIDKIDDILAQQARAEAERKQAEKAYNDAIERGDAMFSMEEYGQAKQSYNRALSIRPDEAYPRSQVEKINSLLAQREAENRAYKSAIEQGDRLFAAEDYEPSLKAYEKASEMKPGEQYPKDQITKVENMLAEQRAKKREQQALNTKYRNVLETADQLMNMEEYEDAKVAYNEALNIKPNESYPGDQIREIDRILREKREAAEKAYKKALARADQLFDEKAYNRSLNAYKEALDMKPNERYPDNQIRRIRQILDQQKRREEELARKERMYNQQIKKGDELYREEDYYTARTHYKKALQIKPGEEYPGNRLKLIANIIQRFESAEKVSSEQKAKKTKESPGSKDQPKLQKFDFKTSAEQNAYLNKLAKDYPEGVTTEKFDLGNRTVTRVIVNYDGVAKDYRKVQHSWGGTYFFRNGQTISKAVFNVETRERE